VDAVNFTVPDPARALAEIRRTVRPDGELRFYEHVAARHRVPALVQRLLGATVWPRVMGGCRPDRPTEVTIAAAGFHVEAIDRFTFRPTVLSIAVAPRILGRARRS
jgi:hypothetical protein